MIKVIQIENIKGIENKRFELNISPNKPAIVVAPNGFGKSSFATAFNSLNSRRIRLEEENYYKEDSNLSPRLYMEFQDSQNMIKHLEATNTTNSISSEFDCFVINNSIVAKGIGSQFGRATGVLDIKDIIIEEKIPENMPFSYQITNMKEKFGQNGKILPNISNVINNLKFLEILSSNFKILDKGIGVRFNEQVQAAIMKINNQSGTVVNLKKWIEDNCLGEICEISHLKQIADIINKFDFEFGSIIDSYLVAIQLFWLYLENNENFKKACVYSTYKLNKERLDALLSNFNCTWKDIRTHEHRGKLIVIFPKATQISNGQRDILTLISMLYKAKSKLKKKNNLLIIDEVFDYLDDANLIAAQYYVTTFIKEFSEADRRLYPIILTHLNPDYFKTFVFNKQKVHYLNKSNIEPNRGIIKLLENRDNETVKDDISKHLLHYEPTCISKRIEFRNLRINELWGVEHNFYQFLYDQVDNYLSNRPFCPFSVCGGVRVKIEDIAYNQIQGEDARSIFLSTWKTRDKLLKAEEMGVISPESHYLLGIIYNEGMHWKNNIDNVSPIASKLENLTIRKLISDLFK